MKFALIIAAAVIAYLALLFSLIRFIFQRIKRRLAMEVEKQFAREDMVLGALDANLIGQKSRGIGQVRGNGALVLTQDELWFLMAVPRREIVIPVSTIKNVGTVSSYMGKAVFRPLLLVEFESSGGEDSIAVFVRDLEAWQEAIGKTMAAPKTN